MSIVPKDPYQPITQAMWLDLRDAYPDPYMREVEKAMTIAKDLGACEALLRGESVPLDRIDLEQAERYGRV